MKKSLIKELDELEKKHWWHRAKRDLFVHYITDLIKKSPKKLTILEIGAGAGNILEQFKEIANVIALDPDKSSIEYCKRRGITRTFMKTLEEFTEFKPGSIDIVIAADVIEHIQDDMSAMKKIYSMLSKNGVLIVHVPADQSLFSYWDKALGHFRRYSYHQLENLLHQSRFYPSVLYYRVITPFPFVKLFRTLKEKVTHKGHEESDFRKFGFMNKVLDFLIHFEDNLTRREMLRSPFGLSLFSVAQKRDD